MYETTVLECVMCTICTMIYTIAQGHHMLFNKSVSAKLAGVARRTLYSHIEEKPISVIEDTDGIEKIDLAELKRVYGTETVLANLKSYQDEQIKKEEGAQPTQHDNNTPSYGVAHAEARVQELEMQVKMQQEIIERRDREFENARADIEDLKTQNKTMTYLLEDHTKRDSGAGEWERSFQALEQRLANQEREAKERKEQEQKLLDENRRIKQAYVNQKKALAEEQNKSIWRKLFG